MFGIHREDELVGHRLVDIQFRPGQQDDLIILLVLQLGRQQTPDRYGHHPLIRLPAAVTVQVKVTGESGLQFQHSRTVANLTHHRHRLTDGIGTVKVQVGEIHFAGKGFFGTGYMDNIF